MTRRLEPEEARELLHEIKSRAHNYPRNRILVGHSPEFLGWKRDAESAIARIYGDQSKWLDDFRSLQFQTNASNYSEIVPLAPHRLLLDQALAIIESMLNEAQREVDSIQSRQRAGTIPPLKQPPAISNRIFIVHGRDSRCKEMVARFLAQLELKAVILHEQPNRGDTIIEKFESYSDVGFAIILLTADDLGRLKNPGESEKPRARQNVIFEFGYFVGKIGRDKVCALLESGVDKPSDLDGIVYVPLDESDTWKMPLVKELRAAGYDVDANKAL